MEKMMKRQELERRALQVVEDLLKDSVSEEFLIDCARFITAANYRDAVEERSLVKLCGYPVCPNKLGKISAQQYKISTKTKKVNELTELKCFCSNFCYKASKDFEQQISKTPLWLRQHESGSSGEEVCPAERHPLDDDIKNQLATLPEDSHNRDPCPADCSDSSSSNSSSDTDTNSDSYTDSSTSTCSNNGNSDSSKSKDGEQEHAFVSSVVSQLQGPMMPCGGSLKCADEDEKRKWGKAERRKKFSGEGDEEEMRHQQSQEAEEERKMRHESLTCEMEDGTNAANPKQHTVNTDQHSGEQALETEMELDKGRCKVEGTANFNSCSLPRSGESGDSQPGLNFIQGGTNKRGAAELRDLLKNTASLNLLDCSSGTMKERATNQTQRFSCDADLSLDSPGTDVQEDKEELDDSDLNDEVTEEDRGRDDNEEQKRSSPAAPGHKRLRVETQQLELRVREFYKETWVLPEKKEAEWRKGDSSGPEHKGPSSATW